MHLFGTDKTLSFQTMTREIQAVFSEKKHNGYLEKTMFSYFMTIFDYHACEFKINFHDFTLPLPYASQKFSSEDLLQGVEPVFYKKNAFDYRKTSIFNCSI